MWNSLRCLMRDSSKALVTDKVWGPANTVRAGDYSIYYLIVEFNVYIFLTNYRAGGSFCNVPLPPILQVPSQKNYHYMEWQLNDFPRISLICRRTMFCPHILLLRNLVFASFGKCFETFLIFQTVFVRKNIYSHALQNLCVFKDNLDKKKGGGSNLHIALLKATS